EHGARGVSLGAAGVDAGNRGGGLFAAEGEQLVGEQVFQALGAGDEKIHWGRLQVGRVLTRHRSGRIRTAGQDPPYREVSSSAKAAAEAWTWRSRRCASSTSSRRARRGRAQATTSSTSIS